MEPIGTPFNSVLLREAGLTVRDVEMLKYMFENRFATTRAIEDRFWSSKGHRNQYRRIKKLMDGRYIEVLHGDGGLRLGYRASRRAANFLRSLGVEPAPLTDLGVVYRTGFDHDRTVLDLRNILESSPLVSEFQAEHIVREALHKKHGYRDSQGDEYKVPDGAFQIKTAARTFRAVLELEVAVKTKRRYRKALKQLTLSREWDLVFIVSAEKSRIALLQGILADLRTNDLDIGRADHRAAIYFASLEEFLNRKLETIFAGERKTFSLASLSDEFEAMA